MTKGKPQYGSQRFDAPDPDTAACCVDSIYEKAHLLKNPIKKTGKRLRGMILGKKGDCYNDKRYHSGL